MHDRYRAALALTSLLLAGATHPHHRHSAHPRASAQIAPAEEKLNLYSRRALRRARLILQLKLFELRREQLEHVRRAIERGIPIDRLLGAPATPAP